MAGVNLSYYKVISSGNVLEVYQYEKEPLKVDRKRKQEQYNEYEKMLLDKKGVIDPKAWIHEKPDKVHERRKQTLRDSRNLVRRLALMNFGSGDSFITLTYAENMQDIEQADDDFKKFMKRFRYSYGDMNYIAVREFQKRGAIHFHVICDFKLTDATESVIREFEREMGIHVWGHGYVDAKILGEVDNVGAYLIKYMTKDISVEAFKGRKSYLCSKGLKRPVEYKGEEAREIVRVYELQKKNPVYANSYISEYLGNIEYKEFNLNR